MANLYIDSQEHLAHWLQYWRDYSFSPGYYKLSDIITTLGTPDCPVEARQEYAARWVLSKMSSKGPKEALIHTAAVWRWNSDLETGNFVLPGQAATSKVSESRIQDSPNNYCQFSYALDTTRDHTLWDAQQALEAYIVGVPGFNPTQKGRRAWQDATLTTQKDVYVMTAQIFRRRSKYSTKKEQSVSYKLHPWIEEVTKVPSQYFPNPDRPRLFQPASGQLRDIADCVPPYIKTGDLVWISFFVEFVIGATTWSTTFTPRDIVRVGSVAPDLVGRQIPPRMGDDEDEAEGLQVGHSVTLIEDFPMLEYAQEAKVHHTPEGDVAAPGTEDVRLHHDTAHPASSSVPYSTSMSAPTTEPSPASTIVPTFKIVLKESNSTSIHATTSQEATKTVSPEVIFGPQDELDCLRRRQDWSRDSPSPISDWVLTPEKTKQVNYDSELSEISTASVANTTPPKTKATIINPSPMKKGGKRNTREADETSDNTSHPRPSTRSRMAHKGKGRAR